MHGQTLTPSFSANAVPSRCIELARLLFVRLCDEATESQRSDQDEWGQIQLSLREFSRQYANLRPDPVRRFPNDGGLALTTENVHAVDLDALEPLSTMDLPLDLVHVGHVEDAHHSGTPPGLLAAVAERLRLDAIGLKLAAA